MSERQRFYERRWVRSTFSVLGGAALVACGPTSGKQEGSYNPHASGYEQAGTLNCATGPFELSHSGRLEPKAAGAYVLDVVGRDKTLSILRLKIRGDASSVGVQINGPNSTPTDKEVGILTPTTPVKITDIVPDATVTVTEKIPQPSDGFAFDIDATCN